MLKLDKSLNTGSKLLIKTVNVFQYMSFLKIITWSIQRACSLFLSAAQTSFIYFSLLNFLCVFDDQ